MDSKNFDAITKLAANASDRRNMMKLAGAAALLGTAGFVSRSDDAEAALVTVVITNVLNGLHIDVDVKNNNVAVQVCAVVDVLSTSIGLPALTCEVQQ